jgi:site-specific recombinase XerD
VIATTHSLRQMLKRRLKNAELPELFSPHSFRVAVVTDLLKQDVPLEERAIPRRALEPDNDPDF